MNEAEIRRIFAKSDKQTEHGQRGTVTLKLRAQVRKKTGGTCHVCGGPLGKRWQVDHVVPRQLGGKPSPDNYLPICHECNRLRWSYSPPVIRLLIRFGIYAKHEIRKNTQLGQQLIGIALRHERKTRKR